VDLEREKVCSTGDIEFKSPRSASRSAVEDRRPLPRIEGDQGAIRPPRRRHHHRCRGAIDDNPAVDLECEKVRSTSDIEFWSPTEAEALLCGCPAVALPALASPSRIWAPHTKIRIGPCLY
jgi:hypothetical protein